MKVAVAAGSNQNAVEHISYAIEQIKQWDANLRVSPWYQSAAEGFDGEDFINCVLIFETKLSELELVTQLKQLENQCGRVRIKQHPHKSLDLDVLVYDVATSSRVHKDVAQCVYVLQPFADLLPNWQHPHCLRTLSQLLNDFETSQLTLVNAPLSTES